MSRAPKRGAKVVFFSETAKPTAIYFQRIPCKGPTRGPAEGQSNHDGPRRTAPRATARSIVLGQIGHKKEKFCGKSFVISQKMCYFVA